MTKKKKSRPDVLKIIRCGIVLILIIYIGMLMLIKGDSGTPFETAASTVEKAADTEKMTKADDRDLKRLYGLNAKDYEDVVLYYTKETMGVEELLLVRTGTDDETEAIENAILQRKKIQMDNFEGYGAEQVQLLKSSIIKIRGNYILFVVSPEADKVEKAFIKCL